MTQENTVLLEKQIPDVVIPLGGIDPPDLDIFLPIFYTCTLKQNEDVRQADILVLDDSDPSLGGHKLVKPL